MKIYERKWYGHIIFASVFLALASILHIVSTYLLGQTIDSATYGDTSKMISTATIVVVIFVFGGIFRILSNRFSILSSNGVISNINIKILQNLYKQPTKKIKSRDDSYYINLMTADSDTLRINWYSILSSEVGCIFEVLVGLSILAYISPWMFLISVSLASVPMITTRAFTKNLQNRQVSASNTRGEHIAIITEAIQGYESLKSVRKMDGYFKRFAYVNKNMFIEGYKYNIMNIIAYWSARYLTFFGIVIQIIVGGYLILNGRISVGELVSANFISSSVSDGISNYIEYRLKRRSVIPIRSKIADELLEPYEVKLQDKGSGFVPTIKYENVSFAFGEKQIINKFSYTFKPGGSYVIVGGSGVGKSTLIKLLLKIYDDYNGTITIDNKDIKNMPENEVLNSVCFLNQSVFLLNDTLKNNITLYNENNSNIETLLRELSLESLANRVGESPLGDFGDNISGGERQRIALARTLFQNPKILILDEPNTGLDPENSKIINEYIFSLKGVTRIVISHDWNHEYLSRFDGVIQLGNSDG